MKLDIENWIKEKQFSLNIRKLFSESVTCYRNGAYRASLIFSYIGFLTVIKEILIRSQRPPGFNEAEWNVIVDKINNDELWEKEVYESLIRTKKPIFQLNEDLKLQLKYWKDRRNDCAHFKRNEIEDHHTESFWSFIKSNISKMTVEGGQASLLNKFDVHFDETKTPPNRDFSHLIREISTSILPADFENFFKQLKSTIDNRPWYSGTDTFNVYSKILDIVEHLRKENRDLAFLSSHSNKISRFKYSDTEIRKLWKTRLASKTLTPNPLIIYSSLLREKLIPKDQIEESNENLFNYFSQTEYHFLPESSDVDTLRANGFYETIFRISIKEKDLEKFLWVNSKCNIIIEFIETEKLNFETVASICKMTTSSNPSQWLVKQLKETFKYMGEIKTDFHNIAKSNGIAIPSEYK
jgi:hypothetical protein